MSETETVVYMSTAHRDYLEGEIERLRACIQNAIAGPDDDLWDEATGDGYTAIGCCKNRLREALEGLHP